jgi:hypothetical protein
MMQVKDFELRLDSFQFVRIPWIYNFRCIQTRSDTTKPNLSIISEVFPNLFLLQFGPVSITWKQSEVSSLRSYPAGEWQASGGPCRSSSG